MSSGGSSSSSAEAETVRRVLVLADDVIWAERLVRLLRASGATPVLRPDGRLFPADGEPSGGSGGIRGAGSDVTPGAVVVDLEARSFDGLGSLRRAREAGLAVLALGPHGAGDLRRAARTAGAEFVPYRRMADDGVGILRRWLERMVRPRGQ